MNQTPDRTCVEDAPARFARLGALVLLLLLLMLRTAWLLLPWRKPAFAQNAYGHIELGMSLTEVEAVIGVSTDRQVTRVLTWCHDAG